MQRLRLFAILQKYDFSSKSQHNVMSIAEFLRCLRYCKSTIFQANHNQKLPIMVKLVLFAILQKYDFSSKSQPKQLRRSIITSCLRYCKSTIFQANHNNNDVVDCIKWLFAILQKYDFSSKSQHIGMFCNSHLGCLRYCKSTIFQANHNWRTNKIKSRKVVCDTAKVRFFKQITT